MRPGPASRCAPAVDAATCVAVALISAAVIAYEVVLMRRLLLEHWHHFGYLVISVALLGFGASGSALALVERRVRARPESALYWLAVGLGAALVIMPRMAALLPVSARFIPGDLWIQVRWWVLYWLAALVPFLGGAMFLGAALMTAGARVGRVYACNLFGSGAGALIAALLLSRFAAEQGLWPSLALACGGALAVAWDWRGSVRWRVLPALALPVAALVVECTWPLSPRYEEHKYAAHLQRLAAQGSARRVDRRADPHGYVELFESNLFHDLPFLALKEAPPPMYSLVVNGDPVGSALRITSAEQAGVMDGTLMAFPYRLICSGPNVLLVGESGGANVWLARRREAARIDVVQPNAGIIALVRQWAGAVFDAARVSVTEKDPRSFLASVSAPRYDLIQIVALEGLGVGSTGVRGLAEDHLATVQGLAACLRVLRDDGVVVVSRGVEEPARENIRLFATLVEALESIGVTEPARHMIQVRDYLGVCTIAARSPLSSERRERLRAAIHEFNLTPVWYDGLPLEEVNQPDTLSGPPGTRLDWLHFAAAEILSPRREQFYDSWLLNVRPTHDDQPFFWDFYKPQAMAALQQAYGELWLTRAEIGRLFLYASLWIGAGAAIVLILMPLMIGQLRRRRVSRVGADTRGNGAADSRRSGVAVLGMILYFGGIGIGFMAVEMALISRAIHWIGDPVIASAVVIGGLLVVSGVGSLTDLRIVRRHVWLAPAIVALVIVLLRLVGWTRADAAWAGMSSFLAVALAAAFFMGMPMPAGIGALNRQRPELVCWAWGMNGVASVIATSAAIAVAMTAGYRAVVILAAAAYALAALAGRSLWCGPIQSHRPLR